MLSRSRWAWARLSADTLFVVLLATFAGLFDLLDPLRDEVTQHIIANGSDPQPLHFVRASAYLITGLGLGIALLWSSVKLEVIARFMLCSAVLLNVYRHVYWLGVTNSETLGEIVLFAILVLVTWLRLSFLLGNKQVVVSRETTEDGI